MPETVEGWREKLEAAKRWLFHVLQFGIASAPFFAKRYGNSPIVWPPLENISVYGVFIATCIIGLFSLFPRLISTKKNARKWFFLALLGTFFCFLLYATLIGRYVITVNTPHDGRITRSVGFIVEPLVHAQFPTANYPELLMIGGTEEWQIKKVWTPDSVLALRLCIFLSFTLTLSLANIALGAAVRIVGKVAGRKLTTVLPAS